MQPFSGFSFGRSGRLVFGFLLAFVQPAQADAEYDLESDRSARIERAHEELGAKIQVNVIDDVFVVAGNASGVTLLKSALGAYFNGRFTHKPDKAVSVYLFSDDASYLRYCKERLG